MTALLRSHCQATRQHAEALLSGSSAARLSNRTAQHIRPPTQQVPHLQHALRVQSTAPNSTSSTTTTAAPTTAAAAAAEPIDDFATDKRPVILFDGVCNLCNGAVDLMLDLDLQGSFRLAALQSPAGKRLLRTCGRSSDDISSIVLVEQGARHYIKSEAVLRIAGGLSNPFPILALFGLPVPPFVRDVVYDLVADNRYSFRGKRDVCRVSDERFTERFIAN